MSETKSTFYTTIDNILEPEDLVVTRRDTANFNLTNIKQNQTLLIKPKTIKAGEFVNQPLVSDH